MDGLEMQGTELITKLAILKNALVNFKPYTGD